MLNFSEAVDKLLPAMLQAQSKFPIIPKTTPNPFYKSKYADLGAVWGLIRGPLAEAGLLIIQDHTVEYSKETALVDDVPTEVNVARVTMITRVIHVATNQSMSHEFAFPSRDATVHGIQSAVTYMRRSGLMSVLGIVADNEDDDGNVAQGNKGPASQAGTPPVGRTPPKAPQQAQTTPQQAQKPQEQSMPTGFITKAEQDEICAAVMKAGITKEQWVAWLKRSFGIETVKAITREKLTAVKQAITSHPEWIKGDDEIFQIPIQEETPPPPNDSDEPWNQNRAGGPKE